MPVEPRPELTAPAPAPLLVDDKTAAAMLSVSRATLHRRRAAGQFVPAVRCGRCLRYRVADLESFVVCGLDIDRWRALQTPQRLARAM